jgi:hypothetical protein
MKSLFAIAIITTFSLSILAVPAVGQPPVTEGTPAPAADLPTGVIVMWSGQLDAIPVGWALCDGSDGTPDLSNRFVLGAGAAEYLGRHTRPFLHVTGADIQSALVQVGSDDSYTGFSVAPASLLQDRLHHETMIGVSIKKEPAE